ncbi:MAG: hypothetical protein NTW48_09585 [Chloroflexi bacterium]|nr:hypothetical protein [Chloroflexota bacterium]
MTVSKMPAEGEVADYQKLEKATLPQELVAEIDKACQHHGLSSQEVITAVAGLVAGDVCTAFYVWDGPSSQMQNLQLDVFVLGKNCLYNYERQKNFSGMACIFLDTLHTIGIASVDDARQEYVLVFWRSGELTRAYGHRADVLRLAYFANAVKEASIRARSIGR